MVEICDNGLDDDGDGRVDLNDEDCECPLIEPVSLIRNPSFEDRSCCPSGLAQLSCAFGWIQASFPTTDYINTCGWRGPDDYFPPLPLPDGEGVMGFRDGFPSINGGEANPQWKEYAGACLLSPLEKDITYRFEFFVGFLDPQKSPPITISFFGTTDCDYLPFGGIADDVGCPTNDTNWVWLGDQFMTGRSNQWVEGAIEVTPDQNISAIAIGPACPPIQSVVPPYYYFDNLILADRNSFDYGISGIGDLCADDFTLQVPEDVRFAFQWYKDGVALIGETQAQLSHSYGNGVYQVRTMADGLCRLTETHYYSKPIEINNIRQTICDHEVYQFGPNVLNESGTYADTLKTAENCDSIVTLDLNVASFLESTSQAKIFEGEAYQIADYSFNEEGRHEALISSNRGCDSLVIIDLDFYDVYIPNVFSPNEDGENDHFTVTGNADLIEVKSLIVYDRWGRPVYSENDLLENGSEGWDGSVNGEKVNPGIYVYISTLLMDDGIERKITGSVLVVI